MDKINSASVEVMNLLATVRLLTDDALADRLHKLADENSRFSPAERTAFLREAAYRLER